jgi:hypothetical protein
MAPRDTIAVVDKIVLPEAIVPPCFGSPDLSLGTCNAKLPLHEWETTRCALYKSCLAHRLAKDKAATIEELADKNYDYILARAQYYWSELEKAKKREFDRQRVKSFIANMNMGPANNPFRSDSMRHALMDLLIMGWQTTESMQTALKSKFPKQTKRIDVVIAAVTSPVSQQKYNYRIIELDGTYRAFARQCQS